MIVQFNNDYVVEAIRHDEEMDMRHHFVNKWGWSEEEFAELEGDDWYLVEVKVTNQQGKSASAYQVIPSFERHLKHDLCGNLPGLIEQAKDELNKETA